MAFLAKCTLKATSAMTEDHVVNTFAFDGSANDPVAVEAARQNIRDFYNGSYGVAPFTKVANLINASISRATNACEVKFYDLDGKLDGVANLGSPIAIGFFTLDNAGGSEVLPNEVALVMSFAANLAGLEEDVPAGPLGPEGNIHERARGRGRIYVGPLWGNVCVNDGSTGNPVPASGALGVIARAGFALIDTSGPGGSGNWCVWSRKDQTLRVVETGYVDNAFDTQRRRGRDATAKRLFSATA